VLDLRLVELELLGEVDGPRIDDQPAAPFPPDLRECST